MHAIPQGLTRFNVTDPIPHCGRWKENMPATRDPEVYRLYIQARKLWRSKIEWELSRTEAQQILADVELASKKGDWGARALLAYFYRSGLGPLSSNKVLDQDADKTVAIAREAAAAGQPWGLYDLGVAHEHGYGGAAKDLEIAWAYYLKAARLGSPDAQLALADAYSEAGRSDAEDAMVQCAYQQGHGAAAYRLAIDAKVRKQYREALATYQAGITFGDKDCADALFLLFSRGYWTGASSKEREALSAIGIAADPERKARYDAISNALQINPDLKLGRLDEFLPLPPAKLPEWRGVSDVVTPESDGPPTY
ncbi:hypothetical protein SAMN05216552_10303 [Pseudoduganella namucuonensis]|uniref:DUF6396 domain-containing protein n=2 Tax=Pseudoduganella namucuonensis TaxID=1035707 RepID=A0A1I7LIB9_9BURK|nr:hypothetical protein SAMN05216552_10303 [Pseudoduganella namucuonensis]